MIKIVAAAAVVTLASSFSVSQAASAPKAGAEIGAKQAEVAKPAKHKKHHKKHKKSGHKQPK